jgi:dolichyl-phosphate beta-glucosyltransferase
VKPDISIVIPAFNESERLGAPLREVLTFLAKHQPNGEVIVIDDGSSDDTSQIAKAAFAEFPSIATQVVRYETNRGKGFAVRTGLKAAAADIALFSDADFSSPIDEIRSGEFDVTFGSRALDRNLIGTHQPWTREQGGRVVNLIIRMMSGLDFADTQCGFKAFNMLKFAPLLDLMQIDRFGFDVEFLFVAQLNGLRLAEIPVRWNDVAGSKVSAFRDTRRMITELRTIRRSSQRGLYDKK